MIEDLSKRNKPPLKEAVSKPKSGLRNKLLGFVFVLLIGMMIGTVLVRPAWDAIAAKLDVLECPQPPIGSGYVLKENQYLEGKDGVIIYRCSWVEEKAVSPLSPAGK
jgi:hypothetical protein